MPLAATSVSFELVVPKTSVRVPLPECGDCTKVFRSSVNAWPE